MKTTNHFRAIVMAAVLLSSTPIFASNTTLACYHPSTVSLKNELGVNLFSLSSNGTAYFGNGLMYKRRWDAFGVRAGINYYRTQENVLFGAHSFGQSNAQQKGRMVEMVSGFEWKFIPQTLKMRFKPYVAGDIINRFGVNYNNPYYNTLGQEATSQVQSLDRTNFYSVGFAPALGFKYRVARKWSATVETGAQVAYRQDVKHSGLTRSINGYWQTSLIPVKLVTLNYHF